MKDNDSLYDNKLEKITSNNNLSFMKNHRQNGILYGKVSFLDLIIKERKNNYYLEYMQAVPLQQLWLLTMCINLNKK